ncbi:MAG: hypothetical protein AAF211_21145 [Myxococcota bacterium]
MVGLDLVVHLIDDDVYLTVSFTSWTAGMAGAVRQSAGPGQDHRFDLTRTT